MDEDPIAGAGLTFVGKYREENQDAIRLHTPVQDAEAQEHGYLFGIADGMGGYSHGGVASTTALETFFSTFYASKPGKPQQNMKSAAQQANTAVQQTSTRMGSVRMGTTLSVANIVGNQLHIAHIGDSRVYLVSGRQTTCVTNDHTHVGEMVRMKLLTPDKIRTHEQRSVLNRCVGMQLFVQPDIIQTSLHEDDYLILCTDGLWSVIEDEEFGQVVREMQDPMQINERLIALAMERDSDDNASAITVHIRQFARAQTLAETNKSRFNLGELFRRKLFAEAGEVAKNLGTML